MKAFANMIKNGLQTIQKEPHKLIVVIIYVLVVLPIINNVSTITSITPTGVAMKYCVLFVVIPLGAILIVILIGVPRKVWGYRKSLERVGLTNKRGEIPLLVSCVVDKNTCVFVFKSLGIPLCDWEEKQEAIETALNVFLQDIRYVNGNEYIQLTAVPATKGIPETIEWNDRFLSDNPVAVAIGVGLMGAVYVDLSKNPHMLIGGSTGSGKTIELKSILFQLKGKVMLYLIDFKGGVDFYNKIWHHQSVTFVTEKDKVIKALDEILDLMDKRRQLLEEVKASNIYEYNKRNLTQVIPIVFACDEIAELLDKNGLSKEEKEKTVKIESKIATIARLGRAFGVHLILATQRPDANILCGQIKNNIDIRLCGRADQVLSMIVLDNINATKIRKDQSGRFIMNDGTEVQGFWNDKI